ncbi:MAG: SusC/RagA family TonB-linked outer membrane protein [Bacteroidetes bacterium]|nr:SusC/RagA family TonB-linked outer membrane protein [Bacteroidota bacterium]
MNLKTMMRRLSLSMTILALVAAPTLGALSQSRTITGKVTSGEDGKPLSGVNVQQRGSSLVSVTDAAGRYSLEVSGGSPTLVFSYAGFDPREISATGGMLDVVLSSAAGRLNEVVVTALGITREEKSLGYSVGKVKGDAMRTVTQENVINALAGRVAGVTVNQIGGVGSSTSIVIRGATSLTSDNQPLFVIDGVPVSNSMSNMRGMGDRNEVDYGNPISDLNPEDIESLTVLKGPSAAALYGSRAGNGVIIVTTKKGRKGEALTVNFSSSNVFETPYRYLDLHYKFSNGNRVSLLDERSEYWAGIELDKGIKAVQWNSPRDGTTGQRVPLEMKSYRDNMKNFLELGVTSTNALSVSGSSDRSTYRLSYTNMTHKGMIPNSDLFRHNLSFTSSYDLTSKLRLSIDANLSRSKSNDRPKTGNRGANEVEAVYNWSHVNIQDLKPIWVSGQEGIQQLAPSDNMDNPYFIAYGISNSYVRDRVFGNVKLEYNFSKALSSHLRLAYDTYVEDRETKIPWSYTRERRGAYHLQDIGWGESNIEFMNSYRKRLGDFSINASAGGNVMMQDFRENYVGSAPGVGLVIPNLYRVSNITAAGVRYSNSTFRKAIYSAFATTSLGYRDQVYVDFSARNDWSSTLPVSNRSYFYPSASLSWLANSTFRLPKVVNLLKFRAGWAQVGNDTNPYALEPVLGTDTWGTLVFNSYPGTLLNPNLKPEINTSQEFGLDLALFNNRLRFEGTYFRQENTNQILNIQSPASSGFSAKQINAGVISSRGLELMVSGTPIKTNSGFTWELSANVTRMRTRLESLTPGMNFITLWDDNNGGAQTFVGQDIGDLYSRGYRRVMDPKSPYYNWPILTAQGSWIPDNTREARLKVGNFNPDAIVGIQSNLRYKRWTLNTSFDWRIGGQYQSFTYRYGGSNWKSQLQMDKLIAGGLLSTADLVALLKSNPGLYIIPQNGNFPRVGGYTQAAGGFPIPLGTGTGNDGVFIPGVIETRPGVYVEHLGGPGTQFRPASNMFSWNYSQQVTFDADFLKLREFSIGYDLPKVKGVRNANLAVFTRNLILWTKGNNGIDPERAFQVTGSKNGDSQNLFRQGIELQNVIPWSMAFGFKLNVTF